MDLDKIVKILNDNKIKNVEILDLNAKSPIMSKIIVGTFASDKNTRAIANQIKEILENDFNVAITIDGEFPGDWIILDLDNIIIELFSEVNLINKCSTSFEDLCFLRIYFARLSIFLFYSSLS